MALSGGGHRASLFGLGALLYLVDAGKGPEISCVSSVSGGSITNGYVGLKTDLLTVNSQDFWEQVKPLAQAVSTKGGIGHFWLTYAYLGAAALILVGAAVVGWLVPTVTAVAVWAIALFVEGWFLLRRGWVVRRLFDHELFKGSLLSSLQTGVDHVVCACELQCAQNVYFSGDFVSSYYLGRGVPGNLQLSRAVQASAALPGAFAPSVLPLARHHFPRTNPQIPRLLLADGGVYDNMATEWPLGAGARAAAAGVAPDPHPVEELIVVNSSAGPGPRRRSSLMVPLLGEPTALLADEDVLYRQTTAVRRRLIYTRFRATARGVTDPDIALRGGIAQINQSPYDLPGEFASGGDALAARAAAALGKLPASGGPDWAQDVQANASVKTTLSRIPADRAARLMRHAYALTMVNLHVLLDYPLADIPALEAFLRLVT